MHPAAIAVTVWGSALVFALSLYGLQALILGPRTLQRRMRRNRARLTLDRPQIKRRPPSPSPPPSRNGHNRARRALVGMPHSTVYPRRVERE